MIRRFIHFFLLLVIITGMMIHFHIEVPWLSDWIGHLPGDLVLKKGDLLLHFPFTTSAFLAVILVFVTSFHSK